jgi:hypothetical protein
MTNMTPRRALFVTGTRLEADDAVVRAVAASPRIARAFIAVPRSDQFISSTRDLIVAITRGAGGLVRGNRSLSAALDTCMHVLEKKQWPVIHLRGESDARLETADVLEMLLDQGSTLIISNQRYLPMVRETPQLRRRAHFVPSESLTPRDIASICGVADER